MKMPDRRFERIRVHHYCPHVNCYAPYKDEGIEYEYPVSYERTHLRAGRGLGRTKKVLSIL